MNNKNRIAILVLVFALLSIVGKSQQLGTLTFRVTNLKSSEGAAIINLFRKQDDVPKKPFKTLSASIQNGISVISFNEILIGEYAAIAYHDENLNGRLDHKMGFPNEPMGFSNNWNLSLFSGTPTFKKLKFMFESDNAIIKIRID
jgi:uncharacterized protein (DUF2141 family)